MFSLILIGCDKKRMSEVVAVDGRGWWGDWGGRPHL